MEPRHQTRGIRIAGGKRFAGAKDLCRLSCTGSWMKLELELELTRRSEELMAQPPSATVELGLARPRFGTGVCTAASRERARVEIV